MSHLMRRHLRDPHPGEQALQDKLVAAVRAQDDEAALHHITTIGRIPEPDVRTALLGAALLALATPSEKAPPVEFFAAAGYRPNAEADPLLVTQVVQLIRMSGRADEVLKQLQALVAEVPAPRLVFVLVSALLVLSQAVAPPPDPPAAPDAVHQVDARREDFIPFSVWTMRCSCSDAQVFRCTGSGPTLTIRETFWRIMGEAWIAAHGGVWPEVKVI